MRIIFIRHGESTANLNPHIITGVDYDAPLTKIGIEKVRLAASQLEEKQFIARHIYVSSTVRTKQTAQLLFPFSRITVDERLIELSQGKAEGTHRSDSLNSAMLAKRTTLKKDFRFTDGESMNQAAMRLHEWVQDVRAYHTDNETLIVVTHSMLTRSYISSLLGWSFEETLENSLDHCACIDIRIDTSEEMPIIHAFNIPIGNVEG